MQRNVELENYRYLPPIMGFQMGHPEISVLREHLSGPWLDPSPTNWYIIGLSLFHGKAQPTLWQHLTPCPVGFLSFPCDGGELTFHGPTDPDMGLVWAILVVGRVSGRQNTHQWHGLWGRGWGDGGLKVKDRFWLGSWLFLSLAESQLSSISKAYMCRVTVRIRNSIAGKALHRHHDLITAALVLLPPSRHPLQVAAWPQSHIPQYKLGSCLIQTLHITSVCSHPHAAPHRLPVYSNSSLNDLPV